MRGEIDLKSLTTKLPPSPANGVGTRTVQAVEVMLRLDDELRKRLERQREIVAGGQAAREFGVTVDIAMVARVALIRGLERMESGAVDVTEKAGGSVEAVSANPIDQANQGPPAGESLNVDYNEAGEIAPPEGWNKWNGKEMIPPEQQEVHDYYIGQGLWRYWGKSGDQLLTFYWSPKKSMSDVATFSKKDGGDKSVMRQMTPWGPGHILPVGWGLRAG